MRTIHSLPLAMFAVLAVAGTAIAQDKPPALLSDVEVRQLVASAEPADCERLASHFAVLASRYAAEAKRHQSMAQASVGSASRPTQTGMSMSAHCKRLAQLNTDSATTLNELANHYRQPAAGAASSAPPDGARFEAGLGAPVASEAELVGLAGKARTPADHEALEQYFEALARRYTTEAKEHAALAVSWKGATRVPTAAITAAHCDRLASELRDAAKEAAAAAAMHKELAGVAR